MFFTITCSRCSEQVKVYAEEIELSILPVFVRDFGRSHGTHRTALPGGEGDYGDSDPAGHPGAVQGMRR